MINTKDYNKAIRIPYNSKRENGYQPRPQGRLAIRSIIVHTTNGNVGTSLAREANYIANSREISAHYLIGKNGEIIQFLDPEKYIAYHAGCVRATAFSNPFSIGIEMHNTPAEGHITIAQQLSLNMLVTDLIKRFNIKHGLVETHRNVAVFCKGHARAGQLGRKIDPSGFPDKEFYAWTDRLFTPTLVNIFQVKSEAVNVRTSPQVNDHNIAGQLTRGDIFTSLAIKDDEKGQIIKGIGQWAHLSEGKHNGKSVNGLGFVHLSNLIKIG